MKEIFKIKNITKKFSSSSEHATALKLKWPWMAVILKWIYFFCKGYPLLIAFFQKCKAIKKKETKPLRKKKFIGSYTQHILLLAQNENVDGAKALGVESIVSHLIFLILGGLRSFNRKSFRASPNSHFELGGVYL